MFSIKCHACGAVYELDEALAGEIAECAECPALFKIVLPPPGSPAGFIAIGEACAAPPAPAPEIPTAVAEAPAFSQFGISSQPPKSEPKKADGGEEFTNTVKLKRPKSEGMIPQYNTPWRQAAPGTRGMAREEKLKDVAEVKCPFCAQNYELSKEMIDKEVQCAACSKVFTVPRDGFIERPVGPKDSEAPTVLTIPEKKSFWAKLMFWKR